MLINSVALSVATMRRLLSQLPDNGIINILRQRDDLSTVVQIIASVEICDGENVLINTDDETG